MKPVLLCLCLFFSNNYVKAQKPNVRDSLLSNAYKTTIAHMPFSEEYSNFITDPRSIPLTNQILQERLANTIVIIDDKILRLDSKEYIQLIQERAVILPPTLIKDETSQTGIQNILIYKKKKNSP